MQKREAQKRRQLLLAFREKFGVPADEVVLHMASDVYRKKLTRKSYGSVFVSVAHLAFLPGTASQQNERWIARADEVETAFVDKAGALEVRFVGSETRTLHHEDKAVLMELVSHINQMKSAHGEASPPASRRAGTRNSDGAESPSLKRHNIRDSLVKSLSRTSRSTLSPQTMRRTLRQVVSAGVDSITAIPGRASDDGSSDSLPMAVSKGLRTPPPGLKASAPSTPDASVIEVDMDEEDSAGGTSTAKGDALGEGDSDMDAIKDLLARGRASPRVNPLQADAPDWLPVRITDLLTGPMLSRILDKRARKSYAAGSEIIAQDQVREVAIQVLYSGKAKSVRKGAKGAADSKDLFLGYISEGSVFGEVRPANVCARARLCVFVLCGRLTPHATWKGAYLLEQNAGATVVAETDCVVYNCSGPVLDGLFEADRAMGAAFFEFVCLVILERTVVSARWLCANCVSLSLWQITESLFNPDK